MEYALGLCGEPVALLCATHLSLCPRCRTEVLAHEKTAGTLLSGEAAPLVPSDSLPKILARLETEPAPPTILAKGTEPAPSGFASPLRGEAAGPSGPAGEGSKPRSSAETKPLWMPNPIWEYTQRAGGLAWRFVAPGVRRLRLHGDDNTPTATLYRFRPGTRIPFHDHAGDEYAQVLTGGFTDGEAHLLRGDVMTRPAGYRHKAVVDSGETCFALVVAEAPTIPLTGRGHLLRLLRRD